MSSVTNSTLLSIGPDMTTISELARNEMPRDQERGPLSKRGFDDILPLAVQGYEIRYRKPEFSDHIELGVWDGDRGVAIMRISPASYHGIKAHSVGYIGLNPHYQGKRLGFELYKAMITQLEMTLLSSGSHSPGARKLWLRLSQDPEISAYGFRGDAVFKVRPNRDATELTSTVSHISVYSNIEDDQTGLILVKKGSSDDAKLDQLTQHA